MPRSGQRDQISQCGPYRRRKYCPYYIFIVDEERTIFDSPDKKTSGLRKSLLTKRSRSVRES